MLFLILLVSGCEHLQACKGINCPSDEEILAQAGAVRLTPNQVKRRVLGNTEEWIHGGAYYVREGELEVKWRKVRYKGSWEVSDDGTLCYQLPRWEKRCHFYMDQEGAVYLLDEGRNIGVSAIYEGNQLRQLGRPVKTLNEKR